MKQFRVLLLFCLLILPGFVLAQNQFYVQSDNAHYVGGPVKRASNGDLIQLVTDGTTGLYMIRTDSNGVSLLNRKFMQLNQFEKPTGLVITDDNGCIVLVSVPGQTAIYPSYSVKTDSQGNILWTKFHKTERPALISCYAEMPNGTIILGGKMQEINSANSDMMIMCIDTAGNQLWCKTYSKTGDEMIAGCTVLPGSAIMITAKRISSGNTPYTNYLTKLTPAGNIISSWDFTDDVSPVVLRPGKFHVTTSGRTFLTAYLKYASINFSISTMLIELDTSCQVIQYAAFSSIPSQFYAISSENSYVYETSNGKINLFTTGYSSIWPSLGLSSCYISFDNQLNLLNSYRTQIYAIEIIIEDMLVISDDLYVQSCHLKDYMVTSPQVSNFSRMSKIIPMPLVSCFYGQPMALVDTTLSFNSPVPISLLENNHMVSDSIGMSVSLNQILPVWTCLPVGIEESETNDKFNAFPNPFNTETFINISGQQLENTKMILSDTQGRIHESGFGIVASSDGIRFINKTLVPGCYFLVIQEPGKIQRIKLMIV